MSVKQQMSFQAQREPVTGELSMCYLDRPLTPAMWPIKREIADMLREFTPTTERVFEANHGSLFTQRNIEQWLLRIKECFILWPEASVELRDDYKKYKQLIS